MKVSINYSPKCGDSWSQQEAITVIIGDLYSDRPYGSCFMPLSEANDDIDLATLYAMGRAVTEALKVSEDM